MTIRFIPPEWLIKELTTNKFLKVRYKEFREACADNRMNEFLDENPEFVQMLTNFADKITPVEETKRTNIKRCAFVYLDHLTPPSEEETRKKSNKLAGDVCKFMFEREDDPTIIMNCLANCLEHLAISVPISTEEFKAILQVLIKNFENMKEEKKEGANEKR